MNCKQYNLTNERTVEQVQADIRKAERRLLKDLSSQTRLQLSLLQVELYRIKRRADVRRHRESRLMTNVPMQTYVRNSYNNKIY